MSRLYLISASVASRRCSGHRILVSSVPLCVRAGYVVHGGVSASLYYLGVSGVIKSVYIADSVDVSNNYRVYLDESTQLSCSVRFGKSGRVLYSRPVFYDRVLGQLYVEGGGLKGSTCHGRGATLYALEWDGGCCACDDDASEP